MDFSLSIFPFADPDPPTRIVQHLLAEACSGDVGRVLRILRVFDNDNRIGHLNNTDRSGQTALHLAVESGNRVATLTLISAGADMNLPRYDKATPLMTAIMSNKLSCVRDLIHLCADLTCEDSEGKTALMTAAFHGKEECLQLLIEAGSDVNVQNRKNYYLGFTALMYAAQKNHINCLKLLLKAGADVNAKTPNGETALVYAVKCFRDIDKVTECVKTLVKWGADVNVKANEPLPCFLNGASFGNGCNNSYVNTVIECVKFLLHSGADVTRREGGITLLCAARSDSLIDLLPILLEAGADIDVQDGFGMTALATAIVNGGEKCANWLLNAGADVKTINTDGETVLMQAARRNFVHLLPVMVEAGVVIDQQDSYGNTALTHALGNASHKCVCWLLDSGADVTNTDTEEMTSLMYAARHESLVEVLPILVNAGAVIDQQDSSGMTALIHAIDEECYKCALWLLDSGADVTKVDKQGLTALMYAVSRGDDQVDLLPILVKAGAAIDQQDYSGMTALTHAVSSNGHYECIRWLVDSGASVNICDHTGKTPLHFLMSSSYMDDKTKQCLEILLSKDANVNAHDNDGMTPLMYVVKRCEGTYTGFAETEEMVTQETMTMLLEHGAELNALDSHGQTALIHSLMTGRYNNIKTIRFLVDKGASFSFGRLATGPISKLADLAFDFDLTKLQIGNEVDLHVSLNRFASMIERGSKRIFQFLVMNGVMPQPIAQYVPTRSGFLDLTFVATVLRRDIMARHLSLAKYLIAVCYLLSDDLKFSTTKSLAPYAIPDEQSVTKLGSQPWPLVKLCFVTVSTMFGASPGRQERVKNSLLPPKLQNMLLFQEPWSRLCVHQWDKIPLTFSWDEYEKLPKPRPLLYRWPVGRDLVPCDCGECDGSMYKYKL